MRKLGTSTLFKKEKMSLMSESVYKMKVDKKRRAYFNQSESSFDPIVIEKQQQEIKRGKKIIENIIDKSFSGTTKIEGEKEWDKWKGHSMVPKFDVVKKTMQAEMLGRVHAKNKELSLEKHYEDKLDDAWKESREKESDDEDEVEKYED